MPLPDVTMPRSLARFNKRVTNRIQGQWAWLVPPYVVIVHAGRRSGRTYRTPVVAAVDGDELLVGILYGEQSDWVRNLLAAGRGEMVRRGRTYELLDPRVIDHDPAALATGRRGRRLLGSISGKALVARIGDPIAGRDRRGAPLDR